MKKINIMIMILVLVSVVYGVTSQINNFVGQTNPFNLNIINKSNNTEFIDIPLYAHISNFTINIDPQYGIPDNSTNHWDNIQFLKGNPPDGDTNIFINSTPALFDSNQLTFSQANWTNDFVSHSYSIFVLLNLSSFLNTSTIQAQFEDTRFIAAQSCFEDRCIASIFLRNWSSGNFKLVSSKNLNLDDNEIKQNFNISNDFINSSSMVEIQLKQNAFSTNPSYFIKILFGFNSNPRLILSSFPRNLTIYTGDEVSFISTSEINESTNITLNISQFNNILSNNCVCSNCEIINQQCRIPININSQTPTLLQVNLTNATYEFGVDNCTNSFNIPSNATSLNLSYLDQDGATTTVDHKTTINYFLLPNTTILGNFSHSLDTISEQAYCQYPSWANLTVNQQIQYTKDDTIYDYFLSEFTYTNQTQLIKLFTENGTTQVLFTVQDINSNPIENAYIHVLKYDVGTGAYTTTEIIRTDVKGQALGNIILGTTFYQFLIFFDGNLVYSEIGVKLITTTRTFTITVGPAGWQDEFTITLGVNTNLYFNNLTNNFVYTWSDPTGEMHFGCLRVDKVNATDKYNLSNVCLESTSGTILFNIDPLFNGTEYYATGYLKFDDEIITDRIVKSIESLRSYFAQKPQLSLFIAFFWCLTLFLIGIPNPTISLAFLGLGLITSSYLGLYAISGLQLGSMAILILVQLYLGGRQQK